MIGLIFCQIISTELLALVAALVTAGVVSVNFIGGGIGFLGDIVLTVGAGIALIGAAAAAGPAALAILVALGLTAPFTLDIPI